MASDEENDLPQTQSQSHNTEEQFSQNAEEGNDAWGRLMAKNKSFNTVGR